MKGSTQKEIEGTLKHIDLIAKEIQDRMYDSNAHYGFIRYAQKHLNDSLQRLKRLIAENQIQGLEF